MYNDELMHYGVKGMKWGVRKGRRKSSTPEHDDYKTAHSKTKVKSMSDAELRKRINRLQMENQYDQLTQKRKSAGQKFVSDVIRESGKEVCKTYVAKYMRKGVEAAIRAAFKG